MSNINKPITKGIYIHIPFCVSKCKYCDFLSFSSDEKTFSNYVDALVSEINSVNPNNVFVETIFFGGGTPSSINSRYIYKILNAIYKHFNVSKSAEITIECNPGTLTLPKLSDYKYSGINRISIGLQSANDNELKAIGRIHNFSMFVESINDARKAGFNNINIDIMSALPYQTLESYKNTLTSVLSLEPTHLSSYSLILEEGTPLCDYINDGHTDMLPDEDTEREMYYLTDEMFDKQGYHRYEISNYAKDSYECKHNLSYWDGTYYYGFGIGAASYVNETRWKNTSDIKKYIQNSSNFDVIQEDINTLTLNDQIEEYMFLGLRKMNGISINLFKEKFNKDIFDVYGDTLSKYSKLNLLTIDGDNIKLSKKGIDISNTIFSDFIFD